jgi:tRNA-dihydrouridine synthase B
MMLCLAPLHGVTNKVYREAYFRHFGGFDGAVAPFILAVRATHVKPRHFKDLLPGPAADASNADLPLVPQLLGNEAAAFVDTARLLMDLGYAEIDWNLGCPYSMVANKQRGSGLLPFPGRIASVLDQACAIPGLAVSVKLRLGRSDPEDIIRLMPTLNGHPLKKVIIHPRLGVQMYRGRVDLDGFARAAELCRHPVVYNGDIESVADYDRLKAGFPFIGEWMIGRGAVSRPFLAEEIKSRGEGDRPSPAAPREERLRAWHEDLYASYREVLCGPAHVLDKMKEAWSYLGASFPGKEGQLERITRAKTLADYEAAASAVLG